MIRSGAMSMYKQIYVLFTMLKQNYSTYYVLDTVQ